MPAATLRIMAARIISFWLMTSASAGTSRNVLMKYWLQRMGRGLYSRFLSSHHRCAESRGLCVFCASAVKSASRRAKAFTRLYDVLEPRRVHRRARVVGQRQTDHVD